MKSLTPQKLSLPLGKILLALCPLFLLASASEAATDSWTGAASSSWNGLNWTGGNNPPTTGDSLIFGTTAGSGTVLIDNLMTPSTFNVGGITFAANAPAFTINPATAGVNGFTLTGNITNSSTSLETINDAIVVAASRTITMTAGGGNITLGGTISGAGGFTTAGTGILTITGTNSYSGVTDIGVSTGTLAIGSNGALGTSLFEFAVANSTVEAVGGTPITIANTGSNVNNNFTITGTTGLTLSGSYFWGGSNVLTVNNTQLTTFANTTVIRIQSASTRTVTYQGTGNILISGSIVDGLAGATGSVTYAGSGTFDLAGTNTYHGATAINSGVLVLDNSANNNASMANTVITIGSTTSGTVQIRGNYTVGAGVAGGSLTLANTTTGPSLGNLVMSGGTNVLNLNSTTAAATVLTLNSGNSLTFGLGATSDEIVLGTGLKATVGTNNAVNIVGVGNLNGTTQTLISAGATSGSYSVGATSTSGSSVYLASIM